MSQEDNSLLYDYRLAKWIVLDSSALPLAREAGIPGRWFLYDAPAEVIGAFGDPPATPPPSPVMAAAPEAFPSNRFVIVTASGEAIFSLWTHPDRTYAFESSIDLHIWEPFSGQETNGNVQTVKPDAISTNHAAAFLRAKISIP